MAKKLLGLEEIAAEVGRLFGTTESHARKWLDQRKALLEALHTVRDNASGLIGQLTAEFAPSRKRGRPAKNRVIDIPAGSPADGPQNRKRRRMSAATRAKMAASQKKRWADQKKNPAK